MFVAINPEKAINAQIESEGECFFMKKFKNWLNEIYLSICLSEKKTCGW